MATVYDLGHYLDPHDENVISSSPAWVILVVRYKQTVTFSREKMQSLDVDGSVTAAERSPIIITSDCVQVMRNSSKDSHVKNFVASLLPTKNYGAQIMPEDWIVCWMLKHKDQATQLVERIKARKPCNRFMDGLKFLGTVYSCRKSFSIDDNGKKTVRFNLVGNGFTQFDSSVFWDPYLSVAQPMFNTWMGNMGIAINKFLTKDGIDVNGAIPEMVEILFGRGIGQQAANPAGSAETQIVTGGTAGSGEAEFAHIVPETIGAILGRKSRSKRSGVLAYADMLHALYGIQKYADLGGNFQAESLGKIFQPSAMKPMLGKFLPQIPQFNGRSVWSILGTYLNPSVNEMYTCLRTNADGEVVPTLVVRQLPFTSKLMAAEDKTSFLELPRWKARDSMILTYEVGRSDALRFNFIHQTGQAVAQAQPNIFTYQLVRSPPIRDDHDARRGGLRPDIQTVACGIEDQQLGAKKWNEIRADILMGQHLTLTGTFNLVGIQEPICEGDNFEYDDVVFHIETVVDTCSIDERGNTHWMTTLHVTHGVQAHPEPLLEVVPDEAIFAMTPTNPDSLTTHDPQIVAESSGLQDLFLDDSEDA
jgi:hypothetical protein